MLLPFICLLLSHEIIDARELREPWVNLKVRFEHVAHTPYTHTTHWFPIPRFAVHELIEFNRIQYRSINRALLLYPWNDKLRWVKKENENLYDIWDSLRDAQCTYYYVHIRRIALQRLLDSTGEERFIRGELPWPVVFDPH